MDRVAIRSYVMQIGGGIEVDRHGNKAGKGALVKFEHAPCIAAAQDTTLVQIEKERSWKRNGRT